MILLLPLPRMQQRGSLLPPIMERRMRVPTLGVNSNLTLRSAGGTDLAGTLSRRGRISR